ncbi:MAG: YceI family protein [Ignavibacteriaceae bacterium]|nr:YceI family protein [Ignavibacteriaceae bacterium]
MKTTIKTFTILLIAVTMSFAQGFKVKATGEQTFNFEDKRNQVKFFSTTPLEDITGISNDVKGKVTLNVSDIKTMKGSITISVASIKTAIDLRDEHLRSENWLDASTYPEITFTIKKVGDVKVAEDNRLEAKVTGDFSVHGVTKEVVSDVTLTYLDASEQTAQYAPGDLMGVQAKFNIMLSDYNVENMVVGQKVADSIEITATLRGSNAK